MESEVTREPMQEEVPKPKSFFSRLGGVYFSPRETFLEIGRSPAMLVPLIVLVLLSAFSAYWIMKRVDLQAATRGQLEQAVQDGKMTQEQMNQQLAIVSKIAPLSVVTGGISGIVLCLIIAGFGKLFSLFAGAENRFKPLFAVTLYVMIAVSIVSTVLMILILQLKGPGNMQLADVNSILASNLGALLEAILGVDVLPKFVFGLAKAVDIFAIWMIALLAIGFAAVSKKLKTSTAAIWLGGAYALYAVIAAAIGAMTAKGPS